MNTAHPRTLGSAELLARLDQVALSADERARAKALLENTERAVEFVFRVAAALRASTTSFKRRLASLG